MPDRGFLQISLPEGSLWTDIDTRRIRLLAALILTFFLAFVPCGGRAVARAGEQRDTKQPFAWNQDEYWNALEKTYLELKQGGCTIAVSTLNAKFDTLRGILNKIDDKRFDPNDPIFRELEGLVFEIGPVVSACDAQVMDYVGLIAEMRTVIKKRSIDWDMNSEAARTTLYRLLYGSRAAAEEVILQTPAAEIPKLVPGKDEPSQTPWADVRNVRIHSGDILVSRGGAPTSALIARGSDYPGNFSHIAFVYVDPFTRTAHIIESHIEKGVVVSTVEQYLEDMKLRVMLLRPRADLPQLLKDPMIPHKAALNAYNNATKNHIPYDFEMNYHDHSKLFCSEVASAAYEPFGVKLWMGISHISSPGLQRWLSDFGVRYFETQEPSDLEYDPQLSVVAEWRDPETLRKDHYDNAVTDVMLEGAEQGDELTYAWYLYPAGMLVKVYSATLNLIGMIGPVPEGMPATVALRTNTYMKTHDKIAERLEAQAEKFKTQHSYEPPYWQLVKLARIAKQEVKGSKN